MPPGTDTGPPAPAPVVAVAGLVSAVAALPAPEQPRDGDCLTVAPEAARRLAELGHPAVEVTVIGWLDPAGEVIGFVHRAVLVTVATVATEQRDDPDAEARVVDLTARQFNLGLPGRWVTTVAAYEQELAGAAGVHHVTLVPRPGAARPGAPPR